MTAGTAAAATRHPGDLSITSEPAARLGQLAARAGAHLTNSEATQLLATSATPARLGRHAATKPPARHAAPPPPPVYLNPFRSVTGLAAQRIDMGADFGGSGPVYPIGDAVITDATGADSGWPGGGWVSYQLTDGPAAGLMVYVAEDVHPTVQVGQRVTPETVIADMFSGSDGIETGWATTEADTPESELAVAGGIGGSGPFPTMVGANFDELLVALGVPAAPNAGQAANGVLPSTYPGNWNALVSRPVS